MDNERKKLTFVAVGLVSMLFIGYTLLLSPKTTDAVGSFECQLQSIDDGSIFNLSELGGTRFVLQVFAPWCGYCIKEHPTLVSVSEHVPVYAIVTRSDPKHAKEWLLANGNPYKFVGMDATGKCLKSLGVEGVPVTSVISESGKILFQGDSRTTSAKLLSFFKPN